MFDAVAMLSDFGTHDHYVGMMKGVIQKICPGIPIVDVSHDLHITEIPFVSMLLAHLNAHFPERTIYVVVIDPGVGTDRRALLGAGKGFYVVCPDNGTLSTLTQNKQVDVFHEINNPAYIAPYPSPTFHGRDIFAYAAGWLARGASPRQLGPRITDPFVIERTTPNVIEGERILGEVIHIDHFGNCISDISAPFLIETFSSLEGLFVLDADMVTIGPILRTYADAAPGAPSPLIGSMGLLEIAINGDRADVRFDLQPGDPLIVVRGA